MGIHDDSYEILLQVLSRRGSTSFSKRWRLESPSARLLWIIRNHLPTYSTSFSFHSG